jgi:hypothetical protein
MNPLNSRDRDYSDSYLDARAKIDDLCRRIVVRQVTTEQAMKSYERIENEYAGVEPGRVDLFRMIYRSRIARLADQFSHRN